jgi:hypothetical protein
MILVMSGCSIRPDLSPPGDIYRQRFDAVVHDPFPSNSLGPAIEGARPLEYDRPLDEATGLQTNPFARRVGGFPSGF